MATTFYEETKAMMVAKDLSTPAAAREHARAQANDQKIQAANLPAAGVPAQDVLWDEKLEVADYASRVLVRGSRLRITDLAGDGCVNFLVFNADHPIERLNVADTVKVQWNAYLGGRKLLLSDMGRVLMSVVADTSGRHDLLCGASTEKSNARKYGAGANYSPFPNARDRFLLALAKHGLGRKDIPPSMNFFKRVNVEADGALRFEQEAEAGAYVELRAEMNVLVVLANTPHVLDPRPGYSCTSVRVTAWRAPVASPDDPIRGATPEAQRAFENTDDYFR
ncbi:MAG TPA: urea amidolyase associated protein UAAP1 [Tepidisphaeraceae bacterium]|nr:urea amidolyase associated protein UAAP1 [Tepidisphaeraceae bacterium]HEV8603940.1 urea amidolyase associated protein UAAP1 [Tepidisphaeraceae bacterium]